MAKIYISSTYTDLKKERKAAAQAIQRLEHQAIAMEYYVASDPPPVDKCLADVKRCDAYIGIFAWRYGSIPHGYDKSITHLEFEAAKQAGIPCLIFLLNDDALWPPKYMANGEERQKILQLRDELKQDHVVSFFKNADQLSGLVSPSVINLKLSPGVSSTVTKSKPKLGSIVSKLCDRYAQVTEFKNFFEEKSGKCPHRPHFYIIHGSVLDGHDSFLERLMKTYLRDYAKRQWGENYAALLSTEVPWPRKRPLEDMKDELKNNLIDCFKVSSSTSDFNADILARSAYFNKCPLVIIKHKIHASKWDKTTPELIRWYIEKSWGELTAEHKEVIPLFLVFFKVIYQQQKMWIFDNKKRISKKLEFLAQAADEKCPCKLIEELNPIEPEDVDDWLDKYEIIPQKWERRKFLDSIFIENKKRLKSICWLRLEEKLANKIATIEEKLYHNPYQREESYP